MAAFTADHPGIQLIVINYVNLYHVLPNKHHPIIEKKPSNNQNGTEFLLNHLPSRVNFSLELDIKFFKNIPPYTSTKWNFVPAISLFHQHNS